MFKVRGATVYPSEVEQALREIDGVDNAFVTNVAGAQGVQVGGGGVQHRWHNYRTAPRICPQGCSARSRCRRSGC
jgi:acyl-CoA synthetase (AMP-forming)/AMP-acid ligase II